MKFRLLCPLIVCGLLVQFPCFAAAFSVGERVAFNDRVGRYGGGKISATVSKDRGPSWEYAGRYEVKIDGSDQTEFLNAADLQTGVADAHPAAQGQDAIAGINHPDAAFKIGEQVSFEDRVSRYGGGMIKATVIKDRGPSWEYAGRYEVKLADGSTEFRNKSDLQHGGGQNVQQRSGANVGGAPAPAEPAAPGVPSRGSNPGGPAAHSPLVVVPPGAVHGANDWGRPPARGSFKYGKPNMKPMLGHNAITPPGLQEYFVGTPPGDESPIGRWYTRTGGVWTKKGGPDIDGNQPYEWGNPEVAELINVMPGGTWAMNNHGKITTGKWYDIGQNVIRLVQLADGCDWTASVYDHMIQFKSYQGITKEGNRY
jgi:hypothetical protein